MKLQRKNRLRALLVGALAVSGALVLTACGSDDNSEHGSRCLRHDQRRIAASSATARASCSPPAPRAQKNAMDAVGEELHRRPATACRSTTSPPAPARASASFLQGTDGFAGSDSALKPEEVAASKKICKGGQGIDLPMVGGPIAVGYNVAGVDQPGPGRPTRSAKIFNGKITKWNDPAIAEAQPGRQAART